MSTINSVTAAAYTTTAYESKAAAKKENTEATTEKSYGKDVGYRQLLIDNYIVIFRIDEVNKIVYVITVQYQGQNL